jgi:hypothetical protein
MKKDKINVYSQNKVTTSDNTNISGTNKTSNKNYSGRAAPGIRFYHPPNTPFQEHTCFGCGEIGHSIPFCLQILKLVKDGQVTRMGKGRITRPDGQAIRQKPEETIVEALTREDKTPVSNFIKIDEKKNRDVPSVLSVKRKRSSAYIEDYDCEERETCETDQTDKEKDTYLESESSEDEYRVYPVERTMRNSTQGRQERYDKVFPPSQGKTLKKTSEKDKIRESAPEIPQAGSPNGPRAKRNEATPREVKDRSSVKENQAKGWESEDIVMDDVDKSVRNDVLNNDKHNTHKSNSNSDQQNATRQRVSEISAKVKPEKILESVLKTPIRLEVGELLRTSRELSGILANAIKPQPLGNNSKIEAHSVWTKMRGLLIKIAMHCDGQAINAIIDTGSQLNIVNKHIWKTMINQPIDIAKSVLMNDTNSGEGKLCGLVQNVPLNCGGVSTQANLFVGDHMPFSLLLGRLWQWENYMSIDE